MKRFLCAAALAATMLPAFAADIDFNVTIGQPGFYGRIDIGDYPQPRILYRRPMMVEQVAYDREPIYLRVPPGHAKNWRRHCRKYDACGERVYFVQNDWYQREYVPRYQQRHGHGGDNDRRDDNRRDHRNDRNDRDDRRGDDRGRGR